MTEKYHDHLGALLAKVCVAAYIDLAALLKKYTSK